jgi:nicotinamide-nucleotide amidase
VLKEHGAVSEATARTMAEGVRNRFRASFGLAITGVAGPGGGTEQKPVGLVYVALASGDGVEAQRLLFPGSRQRIRSWASARALDMLRRRLPAREDA